MKELRELERELQKINGPVLKYFRPGLSEREVVHLFSGTDLKPSRELIQLYTWRNGLQYENIPSGKLSFGLNGVFFPLPVSIEMYQRFISEKLPSLFPVFWDDTFLVNLDANSEDYLKIFIYTPALLITEPQCCYDSLSSMMQTFVACFQKGIFSYDREGYFQEQYEEAVQISRSLNPLSLYWKGL